MFINHYEYKDKCKIVKAGNSISPERVNRYVESITEMAGLGKWTPHSLRHSNISIKLLNGIPIKIVADETGHYDPSVTLKIYAHFLKTHNTKSADMMDKLFADKISAEVISFTEAK